jgi:hypothetical protein
MTLPLSTGAVTLRHRALERMHEQGIVGDELLAALQEDPRKLAAVRTLASATVEVRTGMGGLLVHFGADGPRLAVVTVRRRGLP